MFIKYLKEIKISKKKEIFNNELRGNQWLKKNTAYSSWNELSKMKEVIKFLTEH